MRPIEILKRIFVVIPRYILTTIALLLLMILVILLLILCYVVVRPVFWIVTGKDFMNEPIPRQLLEIFY